MSHNINDVKQGLGVILNKLNGSDLDEHGNPKALSAHEVETLIFAFESNVLFDSIGSQFVDSLKSLPVEPEDGTQTATPVENNNEMAKVIFTSALKDFILKDLSRRFGV